MNAEEMQKQKAEADFWRKETLKWVRGVVEQGYALDDARCACKRRLRSVAGIRAVEK